MKPELADLIQNARRELRRSSGIPLSAEELDQERREKEQRDLEKLLYDKFPLRLVSLLRQNLIWQAGKPVSEFSLDENRFYLRLAARECEVFTLDENGEQPLFKLANDDPQFTHRFLVAIGDAAARTAQP